MGILPMFLILPVLSSVIHGVNFDVVNRCSYTVWAAASSGGGVPLEPGQSWTIYVPSTTGELARVWGRTNCRFDANGRGSCASGDCNGLLECNGYGSPPTTLAEYTLNGTLAEYTLNETNNMPDLLDYIDISLVDGFNIPMDFSPISGSCVRGIRCAGNSILDQCPSQLRAPGGCHNPCKFYKTDEHCCTTASCGPTGMSEFFKERCPDAYSYANDDENSTFTCPPGTDYRVTFCP